MKIVEAPKNENLIIHADKDPVNADWIKHVTRQREKEAAWPGAVGICCQCFEPVSSQELHQARPGGRKFHRRCFDRGGYYVRIEEKAAATRARGEGHDKG